MRQNANTWERFNALKIVVGSEVCALYASRNMREGGRYVHADVIRFVGKYHALIKVNNSKFSDCPVGSLLTIKTNLLILKVKLGNFPYGVTEEQYKHHEELMSVTQQLSLFDKKQL